MHSEANGNTLFLRALEPDDIDFLYDIENREDSFRAGGNTMPFSRDFLQRFVYASLQENLLSSGQLRLLACERTSAERNFEAPPVGVLDFFNYDALHRRAEVGLLVCAGRRGQGLGKEMLKMACDYARNHINLHQLYAETAADNESSLKMFEKCGFTRCGLRRQWLLQSGEWVDAVLWQRIF